MDEIRKRDITTLAAGIIGTVARFEQITAVEHYTDTQTAWDILRAVKKDAQKILRKVRS